MSTWDGVAEVLVSGLLFVLFDTSYLNLVLRRSAYNSVDISILWLDDLTFFGYGFCWPLGWVVVINRSCEKSAHVSGAIRTYHH